MLEARNSALCRDRKKAKEGINEGKIKSSTSLILSFLKDYFEVDHFKSFY